MGFEDRLAALISSDRYLAADPNFQWCQSSRVMVVRQAGCSLQAESPKLQVIQIIVSGIALGCIYGLVALGFVLIFKATEAVSFVQGDLMMVGAFVGYATIALLELPYWAAVIVTCSVMAVFGLLIQRVVIRRMVGEPALAILLVTVGLGYILRGLTTMIPGIGTDTHTLSVPYKDAVVSVAGVLLAVEQLVVIGTTVLMCAFLWLLFRFTTVGTAMLAVSQNQLAAYYMGIPVQRLNAVVWGLAAVAAAIAGLLLAPITFVHSNIGFIGLKAVPAAIVGGFGSLPGAIAGGLVIGIVESLSGYYLPEGFKDVAAYVVVLLMLLVMPTGLFGSNTRKKV